MTKTYKIAAIPADGIGIEVIAAGVEVLDALAEKVLRMMGASEVAFDDCAIRYYLVDQLIACNVFPNKRALDA